MVGGWFALGGGIYGIVWLNDLGFGAWVREGRQERRLSGMGAKLEVALNSLGAVDLQKVLMSFLD